MRRREFITLRGGGGVTGPLAARAQQAGEMPIIGFMGTTTSEIWRLEVAAFEKRLRELGWFAGRTVAIEYRWTDGKNGRAAVIATEFVRLGVSVIVTGGNAVGATKRTTSKIPIVFALAVDPVGSGFVDSLSRPGVTGLSLQGPDLAGKRLGLLREAVPSYGTSLTEANRLLGVYTGRVLNGTPPADLPVVQSTKFDLVLNLKTARTHSA